MKKLIMADVHSTAVRSFNMSRIKSKDTKPELVLRKALFKNGLRYNLHDKTLPGRPDIVLKKFKTIIFVHGCFWHGHRYCRYFVVPKSRTEWWMNKITRNQQKDEVNRHALEKLGWNVIEVFECDLRKTSLERTAIKIIHMLKSNMMNLE